MLLTGLALGQLHSLSSPGLANYPASNPEALRTAGQFYRAVNMLLDTGDSTQLRAVLRSGFVDHSPVKDPGAPRDLEGYLFALREAFPTLRLEASNPFVHGDVVATRLIASGDLRGAIDGLAITSEPSRPGFDLVRIEGDRVAERWANSTLPLLPQIETLGALDDLSPTKPSRTVRLERLNFEPSGEQTMADHEGAIVHVESGSMSIQLGRYETESGPSTAPLPVSGPKLISGTTSSIPAGTAFVLANTDRKPATVLLVTVSEFRISQQFGADLERDVIGPGITREVLAIGLGFLPDHHQFRISLRRMSLNPEIQLSDRIVQASELLFVLDGKANVAIIRGEVGVMARDGSLSVASESLALSPNEGIACYPGAEVAYRAAGPSPATMLLVSLTPLDHPG
jgi:predicted ester cyclase